MKRLVLELGSDRDFHTSGYYRYSEASVGRNNFHQISFYNIEGERAPYFTALESGEEELYDENIVEVEVSHGIDARV